MVFRQHAWIITTLTIIFNFSVWIFLNFILIPSVKVSGNSDILPEISIDTINTLRLYFTLLCRSVDLENYPVVGIYIFSAERTFHCVKSKANIVSLPLIRKLLYCNIKITTIIHYCETWNTFMLENKTV